MSTVFHNCVPEKVHIALVFFSFLSLSRTFKFARTKAAHFLSTQIFRLFWIPKNCPLNQATQKNICQNFPTQKNPRIKNFEWKKIPSLIPITSLACRCFRGARFSSLHTNSCSTEDKIPFPLFYLSGKWPINSCEIKCWQAKHN